MAKLHCINAADTIELLRAGGEFEAVKKAGSCSAPRLRST